MRKIISDRIENVIDQHFLLFRFEKTVLPGRITNTNEGLNLGYTCEIILTTAQIPIFFHQFKTA